MTNLAFEIGFDHYRFGLPLDISRFPDAFRQAIRHGHAAAEQQRVSRKKPDMFEKKLLSIRDRALVKGLEVTVSVADLRAAYNATRGCCPITRQPFTFAYGELSDWSVDRIDNSKGYSADNIAIVSAKANQAKGDLDLAGLIKAAFGKGRPAEDLLSEAEWIRMARFYYSRMSFQKPLSFSRLLTECQTLFDHFVFVQLLEEKSPVSRVLLKHLAIYAGKDAVKKAAKLALKRAYHRAGIDVEVVYDSPKLYCWVQSFVSVINAHPKEFDPLLMACMFE